MPTSYFDELMAAHRLLEGGLEPQGAAESEKQASEPESEGPSTETCEELSQNLLKLAAEMREERDEEKSRSNDSETASALGEATGVSEEELKKRLMEIIKRKREKGNGEEGGEGVMTEGKAAADASSNPYYKNLPGSVTPLPPDMNRILAQSPDEDISEADLKKGIMAWFQKRKMENAK